MGCWLWLEVLALLPGSVPLMQVHIRLAKPYNPCFRM